MLQQEWGFETCSSAPVGAAVVTTVEKVVGTVRVELGPAAEGLGGSAL